MTCPLSFGWNDGRELGATGSTSVCRLWKSRGPCSHSCWHWVFLSATSWCQVPMHVAGGEMQSAGVVWFLHKSSKWHTLYMGALSLNCEFGAWGLSWFWIRLALKTMISPCFDLTLHRQWMTSRYNPSFSWIGKQLKYKTFTHELQNCMFPSCNLRMSFNLETLWMHSNRASSSESFIFNTEGRCMYYSWCKMQCRKQVFVLPFRSVICLSKNLASNRLGFSPLCWSHFILFPCALLIYS